MALLLFDGQAARLGAEAVPDADAAAWAAPAAAVAEMARMLVTRLGS